MARLSKISPRARAMVSKMSRQGASHSEIAQEIGVHRSTVSRMLSGRLEARPPTPPAPPRIVYQGGINPSLCTRCRNEVTHIIAHGILDRSPVVDMAREAGTTRHGIYRLADAQKLPIRRGRVDHACHNIDAAIADMRPIEAVEYLRNAIVDLTGQGETELLALADEGLTRMNGQIYAAMRAAKGRILSRERMMYLLEISGSRANADKSVDVCIVKIRKWIKINRPGESIQTVHRMGWRLIWDPVT